MDFNKNNKKIIIPVLAVALLVVAVLGATYAFFNYTRTGDANTIRTGTVNFSSNQTNNNLTLSNVFPIASSSVSTDANNVAEIDITVAGNTTYSGGLEYKLTIVNPVLTATANNQTVTLPLSFVIDADTTDGSTITGLGTEQNTYFSITDTHKTNGTYPSTAMYKRIAGTTADTVSANKDIFVGYIPTNTNINGKIKIKAFLDASRILITDTPVGNDVENDGYENGTVTTGYDAVLSTAQWNSLHTSPLSFQVKVESNEGLWVENPTLYNKIKLMSRGTMNSASDFGTVASSDTTLHPYGVYQLVESNLNNPIYFFRGDHTVNNNVIFDNKCWLVVRTTETNSVRMLYNGTPVNGECTTTTGNNTMISLYQSNSVNSDGNYDYSTTEQSGYTLKSGENFKYNVNRNNAKYVGYTYDKNGTEVNSNMKNALETWYEETMSSEAKTKVETSIYCNDTTNVSETYRSTYNLSDTYTYFGGILRARANTPSVVCPTGANVINSKVGFLTVDEEILAGRTWSSGMQDYLYNSSSYWLASPCIFYYGMANSFNVYDIGSTSTGADGVNSSHGLRPVISLKSGTAVSAGDGSQGNPFVIE